MCDCSSRGLVWFAPHARARAHTPIHPHSYSHAPAGKMQFDNSVAHGGSPWAPSTLANGDGSRLPSDDEKEFARLYGGKLAAVVKAYVTGKAAVATLAPPS